MHFMLKSIYKKYKKYVGVTNILNNSFKLCYIEEGSTKETLMKYSRLNLYKTCFKNSMIYY